MKKMNFPVQKTTLKQFTHWQAKGKTAAVSLGDIYNDTAKSVFDRGIVTIFLNNNVSCRLYKSEWRKVSICLDDDVYQKLENFRLKYGDFEFAKLKELIAAFVEISCGKAEKIIKAK